MKKTQYKLFLSLFLIIITNSVFAQLENSNSDSIETTIPTQEQNQQAFDELQKQSQRMLDLQTAEMLSKKQQEMSGDVFAANNKNPGLAVFNEEYGANAESGVNVDPSQQNKTFDSSDVHRSWASQFIDSIPPVILYTFLGILFILILKSLFKK